MPGEFDAITCMEGRVVVHDARMHPDMVKLPLGASPCDAGESCSGSGFGGIYAELVRKKHVRK